MQQTTFLVAYSKRGNQAGPGSRLHTLELVAIGWDHLLSALQHKAKQQSLHCTVETMLNKHASRPVWASRSWLTFE